MENQQLETLHARNQELKKDLGNAKRLVSKIWDKHPEARGTIEEGTGAWMVFGQDVETSVSAQRVTQAADHIAQDSNMVEAPVVLPEPGINTASHVGFRVIGYTEQQVRELLAANGITQEKAK